MSHGSQGSSASANMNNLFILLSTHHICVHWCIDISAMKYFPFHLKAHLWSKGKWIGFIHREPRYKHARCYEVTPEWSPSNCCQGQPAFSADSTPSLAERERVRERETHIESDSVVESWPWLNCCLLCLYGINGNTIFASLIQINHLPPYVLTHIMVHEKPILIHGAWALHV